MNSPKGANHALTLARKKRYYQRHRERLSQQTLDYYWRNRERILLRVRAKAAQTREQRMLANRERRLDFLLRGGTAIDYRELSPEYIACVREYQRLCQLLAKYHRGANT